MLHKVLSALILAAACGLAAPDAEAQMLALPTARPTDGVFGRAPKDEGLDIAVSTFEGYDDDAANQALGSRSQMGSQYDALDVSAQFTKKTGNVSFSLGERSGLRRYQAIQDLTGIQHTVAGGFAGQFNRTHVSFNQTVISAPFYTFSTLPGLVGAQPNDLPSTPEQV